MPFPGPRPLPASERPRSGEAFDSAALAGQPGRPLEIDPAALDALDPHAVDPLRGVDDAVMLFDAEDRAKHPVAAAAVPATRTWRASARIIGVLLAAALTGAALASYAMGGFARNGQPAAPALSEPGPIDVGTLVINTQPPGAEVSVDGVGRGVTPLTVSLAGGEHNIELRNGTVTRMVPIAVEPGTSASHYFEMINATATGRLEISSDPPGANVSVDGVRRGVTPLAIDSVDAGEHRVAISNGTTTITRTVRLAAGATASVMASVAPRGTSGGWVSFRTPFEMQVFEEGELIGTTRAERLMLPAGRHQLLIANSAYEFSTAATVDVAADRTASVRVDVPNGTVHINAIPWAEVSIDGRAYGVTPLGNLSVPVGPHDIVFRNPQFGERRRTVQVTARTPVRVGVDFNQ